MVVSHTPQKKRHERRVKDRLEHRQKEWEKIPQAIRGGYKKPGSQNLRNTN